VLLCKARSKWMAGRKAPGNNDEGSGDGLPLQGQEREVAREQLRSIEAKSREIGMALCTGASGEAVHLLERCSLDNVAALSTLVLGNDSVSASTPGPTLAESTSAEAGCGGDRDALHAGATPPRFPKGPST